MIYQYNDFNDPAYNEYVKIEEYLSKLTSLITVSDEVLLSLVTELDKGLDNAIEYCKVNYIYFTTHDLLTYDFINLVRLYNKLGETTSNNAGNILEELYKYKYLYNPRVINKTFMEDMIKWNLRTFGPGERLSGTVKHIKKELKEIEKEPHDLIEWVDVILLAMNGAFRHGHSGQDIIEAIHKKVEINKNRVWANWEETPEGQPITHVKETQ